jgi:hypothetical protein
MRIQQTDRVLKESRYARHDARVHAQTNVFARVWRAIVNLFRHR